MKLPTRLCYWWRTTRKKVSTTVKLNGNEYDGIHGGVALERAQITLEKSPAQFHDCTIQYNTWSDRAVKMFCHPAESKSLLK